MSERVRAGIAALGVACLLLVPGTPLRAQSHRAEEAALARHLDSILPAFGAARQMQRAVQARWDSAAQARAAARVRGLLDTVSVGPLRVVTHHGQERLAHDLFADVWSEYRPQVQDSPALEHTLFTFEWAVRLEAIPVEGSVERVEVPRWTSRASVEDRIRQAIGMALDGDLSTTRVGRSWLPSPVRPVGEPADVYRALAVTPSKINRSCLVGDVHACAQALGLGVSPDSWKSWFTPQEERDQVLSRYLFDRRSRALQRACGNGSDASCRRLLGQEYARPHRFTPGTLPYSARQSLLWLALQRGGVGAWDRLLKDPDAPPEQALAEVAGVGVDPLVAAWRRWVLERRPDVSAGLPGAVLAAGAWILLFGALAMRSTRWRLG